VEDDDKCLAKSNIDGGGLLRCGRGKTINNREESDCDRLAWLSLHWNEMMNKVKINELKEIRGTWNSLKEEGTKMKVEQKPNNVAIVQQERSSSSKCERSEQNGGRMRRVL
jgi:hypothetical protein